MARTRHAFPVFKATRTDGDEVIFIFRLASELHNGRVVEFGALMRLVVRADELLDEDITNALETAYQRRVLAEKVARVLLDRAAQSTLF